MVLKQVAKLIHLIVEDRNAQRWNALVEALTPDIQLPPNMIIEAQMLGTAKKAIFESGDFVKLTRCKASNAVDGHDQLPTPEWRS